MEARTGTVTPDDENPIVFKRFNAFPYTDDLLCDQETIEKIYCGRLFELYVFAKKRLF